MTDYEKPELLVDASVWIDFLRGIDGEEVSRLQKALAEGVASWSEMIQLEILNHAGNEHEQKVIRMLKESLICFHATPEVWELAYGLAGKARAKGLSIPSTDILIYATAVMNDLEIGHHDKHLTWLEEISRGTD